MEINKETFVELVENADELREACEFFANQNLHFACYELMANSKFFYVSTLYRSVEESHHVLISSSTCADDDALRKAVVKGEIVQTFQRFDCVTELCDFTVSLANSTFLRSEYVV